MSSPRSEASSPRTGSRATRARTRKSTSASLSTTRTREETRARASPTAASASSRTRPGTRTRRRRRSSPRSRANRVGRTRRRTSRRRPRTSDARLSSSSTPRAASAGRSRRPRPPWKAADASAASEARTNESVLFVPGYEDSDLTRTRRPTARDAGRLSPRGSLRRFREDARAPRACATTVSRRERHPRRHARSLLEVPTARRNGLEVPPRSRLSMPVSSATARKITLVASLAAASATRHGRGRCNSQRLRLLNIILRFITSSILTPASSSSRPSPRLSSASPSPCRVSSVLFCPPCVARRLADRTWQTSPPAGPSAGNSA